MGYEDLAHHLDATEDESCDRSRTSADKTTADSGVPQGTVLGP